MKTHINLKNLKRLQKSGDVMFSEPTDWKCFDIPEDLINEWKFFIKVKKKYEEILKKYELM